jgi:anti-sigma factor RsiW
MTRPDHLTEEQRQGAADGTLDGDRLRDAERHMASCDACARDVAKLRMLMARIPAPGASGGGDVDELWPSIRSRIEDSKVVPLDAAPAAGSPPRSRRGVIWFAGALAAAVAIVVVSLPPMRAARGVSSNASADSESNLLIVADSTNAYEAEATALLNQLELQRAILPPEARSSVDHDLRVIDDAIAEAKAALVRDPNNPAIRRLLASSYRQKVELLKRASGAG